MNRPAAILAAALLYACGTLPAADPEPAACPDVVAFGDDLANAADHTVNTARQFAEQLRDVGITVVQFEALGPGRVAISSSCETVYSGTVTSLGPEARRRWGLWLEVTQAIVYEPGTAFSVDAMVMFDDPNESSPRRMLTDAVDTHAKQLAAEATLMKLTSSPGSSESR